MEKQKFFINYLYSQMIKIKCVAHVFTSQLNFKRKMHFVTRC